MEWFKQKFFEGKRNRKGFWLAVFDCWLISLLLSFLVNIMFWLKSSTLPDLPEAISVIAYWSGFYASIIIPLVAIKRLNDLGQSRWLALLGFFPYLGIGLLIYCGFFPAKQKEELKKLES